mmetsp:Transcript_30064/g.27474  ORF Transcript_30064/g.27474 Transcript_30064/m.27474 type:complete len:84 (+) Transcript_30064:447-698(+)
MRTPTTRTINTSDEFLMRSTLNYGGATSGAGGFESSQNRFLSPDASRDKLYNNKSLNNTPSSNFTRNIGFGGNTTYGGPGRRY